LTELLTALRDAKTIDDALLEIYGFDSDGLEDVWRQSVGAALELFLPRRPAMPTPTFVPTYVPVAGIPLAVTPTPYAVPTSSFTTSGGPLRDLSIDTSFIFFVHRIGLYLCRHPDYSRRCDFGIYRPLEKSKGRQNG